MHDTASRDSSAEFNPVGPPDPEMSRSFVNWWLQSAMDFCPETAARNHEAAVGWMCAGVDESFKKIFWSAPIRGSVTAVCLDGSFKERVFSERNGTAIVTVPCLFVAPEEDMPYWDIQVRFYVRKDAAGYRIASFVIVHDTNGIQTKEFLENACRNTEKKVSKRALDYYISGLRKSESGKMNRAIENYNLALRESPNFAIAHVDRGCARCLLKDEKGALDDFNEAIELNTRLEPAYICRGLVHRILNENKTAIGDFSEAISCNPASAAAYHLRAHAEESLGRNRAALRDYEMALNLTPWDYSYHYFLGSLKLKLGDKAGARRDFEETLRIAPNFTLARKKLQSLLS